MGTLTIDNKNIDMICRHMADGTIIPLKIRLLDDDGAYQEYKIRAYKEAALIRDISFRVQDRMFRTGEDDQDLLQQL